MVIDFHTHAFPDAIAERAGALLSARAKDTVSPSRSLSVGSLIAQMATCGIDRSVILPVVTKPSQTQTVNAWAASLRKDPKLIPFAGLWPHAANAKEIVDEIAAAGFPGVKLHPEYQQFVLDDPAFLPLYDYILSKGLILVFHAGVDIGLPDAVRSSPKQFKTVVRAMGGGMIVAAHLGGHRQWDEVERELCGENIYLDTCMGFSYFDQAQFLRILDAHGADKILFATDSPWSDPAAELAALRALPIGDGVKEMLLHKNAEHLID